MIHSQWIHQKETSQQYMSEYGQNIAHESQLLTSTSNVQQIVAYYTCMHDIQYCGGVYKMY